VASSGKKGTRFSRAAETLCESSLHFKVTCQCTSPPPPPLLSTRRHAHTSPSPAEAELGSPTHQSHGDPMPSSSRGLKTRHHSPPCNPRRSRPDSSSYYHYSSSASGAASFLLPPEMPPQIPACESPSAQNLTVNLSGRISGDSIPEPNPPSPLPTPPTVDVKPPTTFPLPS